MSVSGLDHVQLAAPAGCEAAARHYYGSLLDARRLYLEDPWGNRIEMVADI